MDVVCVQSQTIRRDDNNRQPQFPCACVQISPVLSCSAHLLLNITLVREPVQQLLRRSIEVGEVPVLRRLLEPHAQAAALRPKQASGFLESDLPGFGFRSYNVNDM